MVYPVSTATRKLMVASLGIMLLWPLKSIAISGVNPSGVNVRHNGVNTVFLTFQNMAADEQAVEAFWCGEVTATGVSNVNPCVPGTLFGSLPARHNLSQTSGTGGQRNLTDIMTIPASVTRRAFQDAARGNNSDFFYVRHFSNGISDSYVTVTCRMAGGGARTPLALTNVQMYFLTGEGPRPVYFLARDEAVAKFGAYIQYNGTGRLKGRWEVVLPGDIEPSAIDLLTEATLPVEQRGLQKRYTLIDRFDHFLPPTGSVFLPGPDPELLPRNIEGPHKILLRIEASADKEGNSNTLDGTAISGGVAGFALPVLRYYIGTAEATAAVRANNVSSKITLLTPAPDARINAAEAFVFSWIDIPFAAVYQLEIRAEGEKVMSALIEAGQSRYVAPPWLADQADRILSWRVRALSSSGDELSATGWWNFKIAYQ